MKFFISAVVFIIVFSTLNARKFSHEEIRMFLPFLRHWIPPPCPMNEIYKTCTGKCSDCTQRGRCIVTKCEEGCDCAPRFFRVTPDGPCEPVANCPKPECDENEVFRDCGPICETCTLLECHVISCDHKCYCKEGYLRNKESMCIPKEECPIRTRCSHSEEWSESGPIDEFCIPGKDEDRTNRTQAIPGCYCKEGFRRNLLGRCVNETTCPIIRCFGEEVYHECIPKCNTTCRNYGDPNCTEDDNCYPGCFCPPGFVMNDFRSCIKIEKCSLDIDQVKVFHSVPEEDTSDTTLPPTCPATDSTKPVDDSEFSTAYVDDTTESVPVYANDTAESVSDYEYDDIVLASAYAGDTAEYAPVYANDTAESVPDYEADAIVLASAYAGDTAGSVPDSEDDAISPVSAYANDTATTDTEEDRKAEETTPETTSEQDIMTTSSTNAKSVSGSTAKEKAIKKDKVIKIKETKHENAAKEREVVKYDEEGFGNEDI